MAQWEGEPVEGVGMEGGYGEPPGGAGLTVLKSSGQIGVPAADGLSDPVAMGTAVRWKRIR